MTNFDIRQSNYDSPNLNILGVPIDNNSTPSDSQVLVYSAATSTWIIADNPPPSGPLTSLTVNGPSQLNDTLVVTGASTLSDTLSVAGATTLNSVSVTGTSTLNTVAVTGATSLNTLSVAGASTLNTVAVTGASTLNTVAVTGATSLNTVAVTGATTLGDTLVVAGATTINNTLDVTRATILANTLGVAGATTLNNTLAVTSDTTLNNTLAVAGATTLNNTLDVTGATNVTELTSTGLVSAAQLKIGIGNVLTSLISGTATVNPSAVMPPHAKEQFTITFPDPLPSIPKVIITLRTSTAAAIARSGLNGIIVNVGVTGATVEIENLATTPFLTTDQIFIDYIAVTF